MEGSVAAPARSIMERAKRRLMHQRLGVDFTRSLQTSIPASASASRYDPIDVLQYAAGAPDARRVALAALSHLHISEDANTFRVRLFTDAGLQEFIATVMAEQCGDPACLSAAVALGTKAVARAAESALGSSDLDLATWEFLLLLTVKFEISTLHGILTVNEDRAKALSSEAVRLLIESAWSNTPSGELSRRVLESMAEIDSSLLRPSRDLIIDSLSVSAVGGPSESGAAFLKRLLRLVDRSYHY